VEICIDTVAELERTTQKGDMPFSHGIIIFRTSFINAVNPSNILQNTIISSIQLVCYVAFPQSLPFLAVLYSGTTPVLKSLLFSSQESLNISPKFLSILVQEPVPGVRKHNQLPLLQSLLRNKAVDGRYHEVILDHIR
jgi:hypothetical protein